MGIVEKKTYFSFDESPFHPGQYLLSINDYEGFNCKGTMGSYNILFARLMNLSYAQFLRFCRDVCGAELYGKNCLYIIPVFPHKTGEAGQLLKLLNNLANLVIWERNHPDWEEHQAEMLQKEMKVFNIAKERLDVLNEGLNGDKES